MSSGFGESMESVFPPNPSCCSENSSNKDAGDFECNVCFDLARDPVVTLCGHLFCWPCLYRWLHHRSDSRVCPVCRALVEEQKLVPLYGKGKSVTDSRIISYLGMEIPARPSGQRPQTVEKDEEEFEEEEEELEAEEEEELEAEEVPNYASILNISSIVNLNSFSRVSTVSSLHSTVPTPIGEPSTIPTLPTRPSNAPETDEVWRARIEAGQMSLKAAVMTLKAEQMRQKQMVETMYNWHISRGHFPPRS